MPVTLPEWLVAIDAAAFLLALDSARQYGLVTGGPEVDVDRCLEVLRIAKEQHGREPSPGSMERGIRDYLSGE